MPVKAVGVAGDARTYDQVVALRAVQTEDFMTADWFVFPPAVLKKISSRITNEVGSVARPAKEGSWVLMLRSKESTGLYMTLRQSHLEREWFKLNSVCRC